MAVIAFPSSETDEIARMCWTSVAFTGSQNVRSLAFTIKNVLSFSFDRFFINPFNMAYTMIGMDNPIILFIFRFHAIFHLFTLFLCF